MKITESIKFDKLKEENESLKKELAEKDKEINVYIDILKNSDKEKTERNELKYQLQQLKYKIKEKEIVKLKEEQLYKEDFIIGCLYCIQQDKHDNCLPVHYFLKKDSEQKYDKLPSKEDKTCI